MVHSIKYKYGNRTYNIPVGKEFVVHKGVKFPIDYKIVVVSANKRKIQQLSPRVTHQRLGYVRIKGKKMLYSSSNLSL